MIAYFLFAILAFAALEIVSANTYYTDVYFTLPDTVLVTGERLELRGFIYQSNYSSDGTMVTNFTSLANAAVNLTIRNSVNLSYSGNYTLTTDSSGTFYTRSNYFTNGTLINAPYSASTYYVRAEYKDVNNVTSFSQVEVSVVNQTMDMFYISSERSSYNPLENVKVNIEATKIVGDRILYISNISINGSLRNSAKSSLRNFTCVTGTNGKCTVNFTAPETYGGYILEIGDFKIFSTFSVVPFSCMLNMKDDLGKGIKNVFAKGEQGRVEVKINNATSTDTYSFSGYIADSSGRSIDAITSTTLNSNNSFTNSFLFTVDTDYSYGAYSVHVIVLKSGYGSLNATTSFEVEDWSLTVDKKETASGFEYEFSSFPNKTVFLFAIPSYRSNGTIIPGINSTSFTINIRDSLGNIFSNSSAIWNTTCKKSGCYEFNLTTPIDPGKYTLYTTLSYSGNTQTDSRIINVISGVMSAQSTDKDGTIKELFGTNEFVYFTLSSYNLTNSSFGLSDAEVLVVSYMNGTDYSYNQTNFTLVNMSNSIYEWAWNATSQRLKIDVPKAGGLYNIYIFGNNRTLGAESRFIVNPYDFCSVPKDTPGNVSSGYYYVWQFKTSDTIYFEIKIAQANNPSGRATALNTSSGNSTGTGAGCMIDITKQAVNNATITLLEVKNLESGAVESINVSESTCQASDTSGGYTCTVKPTSKWDGGLNIVKFDVQGQDGTSGIIYSRFEAKAFYLYGWSQNWQNNPVSNITLYLQMYEAGSGWWGGYGSRGLSGSVSVKRIEYMGQDGEWIWPPIDSGYNVSNLNSTSITGSTGNLIISAPSSGWKTGNYRIVLQGTTSSGDSDYGYAWFGVKLWDVYGQPIECTSAGCTYKSYFNSKENVTLYISINKAGDYWWNSNTGGRDIYGNVTVGVKKVQDCRTWPCKELNSSQYSANTITVNQSGPGYWYASSINQSAYIIQINSTSGTWNTGYYNVILDINGTDTGYAWFNSIAFYVETTPVTSDGSRYKSSIRGTVPIYFNISTTKSYKYWNYYSNLRYNSSDYLNTTVTEVVLRTWNQQTYQSIEYNYPEDINVTPISVNGTGKINVTYLNGSWPSGYYSGELTMNNSDGELSTGWLWFEVRSFRVQAEIFNYVWEVDDNSCVNATLKIYDSDWYTNTFLNGSYSVVNVYEDLWTMSGSTRTYYTNYTLNSVSNASSFNATANISLCPNSGAWTGGSWGGWHYLSVLVKDNALNDTQSGWVYFRTVPFKIVWNKGDGWLANKATNANFNVSVNLTSPLTGANATGRLYTLYQWRYDNYQSTKEEYRFTVGSCDSSASSYCTINGATNITIYAPSGGWKVGYNSLQAEWTSNDGATEVQDSSGIYFDGRESYNGWFGTSWYDSGDSQWYWAYDIPQTNNITIKLSVRDSDYSSADVNITSVWYAYSGDNCWDEWCRTYVNSTFSPLNTSNGDAVIRIKTPSGGWTRGYYYIKTTVSGSAGSATILGGNIRVRDFSLPNITLVSPNNNQTYNRSVLFSFTTSKSTQCGINLVGYSTFINWYCYGWNSTTNSTFNSSQTEGACNQTGYGYNGTIYYNEYITKDYHSLDDGQNYSSCQSYASSCYGVAPAARINNYMSTGVTTHTYTLNITDYPDQDYGARIGCWDDDWNYGNALVAFRVSNTA
ncbi:MAG: hypothetical protein ABH840_02620 [Nanoarchaeota archaeon]